MKRDLGVAGLNILLTVVVMLFLAGFIVFIYALVGGEIADSSRSLASGTVRNETLTTVDENGEVVLKAQHPYTNAYCTPLANASDPFVYQENYSATDCGTIDSVNYTFSNENCTLSFSGVVDLNVNNSNWNISYTWVADAAGSNWESINSSVDELNQTTNWFGIIIVITAMVILILLTVIIINAIQNAGIVTLGGKGETTGTA